MAIAFAARRKSGLSLVVAALIAVILASLLYGVVAYWGNRSEPAAPAEFPPIDIPEAPSLIDWSEVIERINRAIESRSERLSTNSDDWGTNASLASAYMDRAQLTQNYDDYGRADELLDRAFAVATPGAGPFVQRAVLDFTLHRLGPAERALAHTDDFAVRQQGRDLAETTGLRGDIAFYRGQYARAIEFYGSAEETFPNMGSSYRMLNFYALTGNEAASARYLRALEAAPVGDDQKSFLAQTRGIYEIQRGRYGFARRSFERANLLFPGYWKIEGLLAQMDAMAGRLDKARPVFARIARDQQSPEAMDTLAAIARYQGNADESRMWAARASAVWDARLESFPEAAYAHALDHELAFGTPAKALRLARANWRARPYGLSGIGLTWALVANGHLDEAQRTIEAVLASSWDTAEAHAAASQVYALSGDGDLAEDQRELARALNPHIFDGNRVLMWFAH